VSFGWVKMEVVSTTGAATGGGVAAAREDGDEGSPGAGVLHFLDGREGVGIILIK
jgi:hypothetical protein